MKMYKEHFSNILRRKYGIHDTIIVLCDNILRNNDYMKKGRKFKSLSNTKISNQMIVTLNAWIMQ